MTTHEYNGHHVEVSDLYPDTIVTTYLCSCGSFGNMLFPDQWNETILRRRHRVHVLYMQKREAGMPDPRSQGRRA